LWEAGEGDAEAMEASECSFSVAARSQRVAALVIGEECGRAVE
jgi:hypothetical protein